MTIRGLFRELVVAKQRKEDERNKDLSLAWHIEVFARQKKLPSLQSLMKTRERRTQTTTEHRTMLHLLAATYGGSVRPITEATRLALRH